MLAFDSGGLATALKQAAGENVGLRWRTSNDISGKLAAIAAGLPNGRGSHGLKVHVARNNEMRDLIDRYGLGKLVPGPYKEPGVGVVTSRMEEIRADNLFTHAVQVRRMAPGGGYHLFLMVPAKEAWIYDLQHPLSRGAEVPSWAPARYRCEPVASFPVNGGMLWAVSTPEAGYLELFNQALMTIETVKEVKPSARWRSILLPVVSPVSTMRVASMSGAVLGDAAGLKLLDVYQMFRIRYNIGTLGRTKAPEGTPDEPMPLAFNRPTLVFKTTGPPGDPTIQWLYHAKMRDWDVFDAK